jgi:cell division protease FtsH
VEESKQGLPPPPPIRDPGGWGVAPAPDGRGAPEPPPPPRGPHRRRGFWIAAAALLALNLLLVAMFQPEGERRVKVAFSPYFLSQVDSGEVESITSRGDSIEGTFKHPVTYPPDDESAEPTTLFSTEVPSFWDSTSLTNLLQSQGVQVNAQSPTNETSLLTELLLGFGPTLLLVVIFILLARRAARAGGSGVLGSFGRSQARRVDPQKITVTF